MSKNLAIVKPRCLKKETAAAYLELEPSGFAKWVRDGIIPGPIPGTRRWDKKAIDAALDKLSGLEPTEAEDPYEEWKRSRQAHHLEDPISAKIKKAAVEERQKRGKR